MIWRWMRNFNEDVEIFIIKNELGWPSLIHNHLLTKVEDRKLNINHYDIVKRFSANFIAHLFQLCYTLLASQVASFYNKVIQKLVPQCYIL